MKYLIPLLLAFAFFITGLFTLPDYGINWDTPAHLLRGQALATYLLTGHKNYGGIYKFSPVLIKPDERISRYSYAAFEDAQSPLAKLPERPLPQKEKSGSFYQSEYWNGEFFMSLKEKGHPPLMDIFSSFLNKLLYQKLNIVGDLESYQLANLLISSMAIFVVSIFTFEITNSIVASFIAGLSLGLFPLFFGESHFNIKDPIQTVFYMASIYSFWNWIRSNKVKWGNLFILSVILALGVKWNIVFLPIILLPWLFLIRNNKRFKDWFNLKLFLFFLLFVFSLLLFIIIILPSAVFNPLEQLLSVFNYYLQTGSRTDLLQPTGFILPFGFNIYPAVLVLTQTPEIILILGGIGIIWGIREIREKKDSLKTGYLLLFWLFLPVLRFSLPHVWFYSGLRQMMEIIPAMAIMAGIGTKYLTNRLLKLKPGNFPKIFLNIFTLSIITCILLVPIIHYHPNQNTYFNSLAGGLKGALDKNLIDWTLTNGNIYKQGADWLNKNAEKNANLAFLDGSMFAISPLYLRDDISISPHHFTGFDQKGEYLMMLYNPLDPPVFAKRYPERFLKPIHNIEVDGVTLLYIYKNDPNYLKPEFKQEQKIIRVEAKPVKGTNTDYFEVNLEKDVFITKVSMLGDIKNCFEHDNEIFAFKDEESLNQKVNPQRAYLTNEKKWEDGKVEFLFPVELAKVVLIYPLNSAACSLQSRIFFISYIKTNE